MKHLIILFFGLLFSLNLLAQDDKVKELITQGDGLYADRKYNEAIAKYKSALELNQNSIPANYKLSSVYFDIKQFQNAIKYSSAIVGQKSEYQESAYVIIGNSLDSTGKPEKAIINYEEGIIKYPKSNKLNYNLALTCYHVKDLEKGEKAAVSAINAEVSHAGSHLVLSMIMQAKNTRVKAILPLYYFLMLEPNSKRSLSNYNRLINLLGLGEEKIDESKDVAKMEANPTEISEFDAADMMVGMLAAARTADENKGMSDLEFFIENNRVLFSALGELKGENTGFYWDIYVTKFQDLVKSENNTAFGYYISQSTNSELIKNWILDNEEAVKKLKVWMR